MKKSLFFLALGLLGATGIHAATINHAYDSDKSAADNGDALKATITNANSGDEIKVQAGTYQGNFSMKEGVNVSGGWNEGFTAQTDYATVLDAQSNGRVLNQSENYNTLTVWSNMTIQNGKFTAQQTDKAGAGVFLCSNGQVKHCLIQNNLFDAESGEASGGGVYENGFTESVLVDDCIIRGNTASHGGGVRICGVIQNSIIEYNTTTINACGGVQLHYGGAMYNCIIRNNTGKDTGGVRITGDKACTMANCLIINNTATGSVGGLQMAGNSAHIVYNNTIVGNNQKGTGNANRCGVHLNTSSGQATKFINNIVWGNTVNGTAQDDQLQITGNYNPYATANFLNNAIVRPNTYGTGTILLDKSTNPGFTNAASGDYSLLETSALVDKGSNAQAQGSYDLAGNARISGSTIDVGAYEYQYPVIVDNYVHPDEDLQAAINATAAGETVFVEAGTYYGNFTMKEGVNVSGGWDATFEHQTDYTTILDAQQNGRVVNQPANFSTLTVWENLTIQNGRFTAQQSDKAGAGVFLCDKGQVKHCLIQNNLFDAESGEASGGGVYENGYTESVLIDDCIIRGNTASHGGGVRICGVIQNSIIEYNTTTINACGGVQLYYGGAMYNCIVRNNTGKDTGGVRLNGNKACTMANCLIIGNTATGTIGGLSLETGIHYVYNNTIVGNNQKSSSSTTRCGVRLNVNANLVFANNIVWGNKVNGSVQDDQMEILAAYASDRAATYFLNNAVVHANVGTSTIVLNAADPGFTAAASGDYSLLANSSLVDAGNKDKAQGDFDLAGNARISRTKVDIGCYEYQYPPVDNYVNSNEDLQEAIDATPAGTTVYVEAGTYYGNFEMKEGVNVSGGWDATFENQTDYTTILDAQQNGRVVNQPANFSTLTVWENLTIQNGRFTAQQSDKAGAGVFLCDKGQVKHCLIQNNLFDAESGEASGGGVYENGFTESVLVDDCIIRGNTASHGGGVRICGVIQNSIIEYNTTTINACGGVQLHYGGAMYNCIVRNNTGKNTGGVRLTGGKGCTMANCLIVGNTAIEKIGGISLESANGAESYHYVYNNTIVGNSQESSENPDWCGVRLNVGGPLQFCNNIVWGNKANGAVQESQILVSSSYSNQANNFAHNALVWNGKLSDNTDFAGVNTILLDKDTDPGFTAAASGDYTLVYPSPAGLIDSGHNGYFHGNKDLAGNARKVGSIDRGCYEYAQAARSYTRNVTAGRYGTICLPYAVAAADIAGATAYKILSFSDDLQSGLLLEEVDAMEAGNPYFFLASAASVSFSYTAEGSPASAGNENGLYGTIAGELVKGEGYYVLQNNELRQTYDAGSDIEINLGANRAYVNLSEIPAYTESAPSPRRRVINIRQEQGSATGMDQITNDKWQMTNKVIKDGRLLIIRDGKTYNVLGQSVNQ